MRVGAGWGGAGRGGEEIGAISADEGREPGVAADRHSTGQPEVSAGLRRCVCVGCRMRLCLC